MAEQKDANTSGDEWNAGFTAEERAAARERARELKASARRSGAAAEAQGEADALAKIATMAEGDRAIAERLHAIIKANAPELAARTWYGMPAYARQGKLICYFQDSQKFKVRYATLGFSDNAHLDDGTMWPTVYALTRLTATEEARILELLRKALS